MKYPIDPYHWEKGCAGPLLCDYCNQVLSETFEETCARITAENAARGLRTAGDFRAGLAMEKEEPTMRGIPDPYEAAVARLRTSQGISLESIPNNDPRLRAMQQHRAEFWNHAATSRLAARQPATSAVHLNPPNSYAEALKRMKEDR